MPFKKVSRHRRTSLQMLYGGDSSAGRLKKAPPPTAQAVARMPTRSAVARMPTHVVTRMSLRRDDCGFDSDDVIQPMRSAYYKSDDERKPPAVSSASSHIIRDSSDDADSSFQLVSSSNDSTDSLDDCWSDAESGSFLDPRCSNGGSSRDSSYVYVSEGSDNDESMEGLGFDSPVRGKNYKYSDDADQSDDNNNMSVVPCGSDSGDDSTYVQYVDHSGGCRLCSEDSSSDNFSADTWDLYDGCLDDSSSEDSTYNIEDATDSDTDDDKSVVILHEPKATDFRNISHHGNKLVNCPVLMSGIMKNLCCKKCADKGFDSHLDVKETTCGIATIFHIHCSNDPEHNFDISPESSAWRNKDDMSVEAFNVNIMAYLLTLSLGIGIEGLGKVFGFLGMRPHVGGYEGWNVVRDKCGKLLNRFADKVCKRNVDLEIAATLRAQVSQVNRLEKPDDPPNMLAPLTVAIDAGWQKRASGRAYNSISGHVFAVGARTKLVLNRIVYGQRCRQCDTAEALGAKAAEHRCPKNYEGSSKGMEPTGAAFLVQSLYEHSKCYVSTVVTDDDSSIRAVLRHSYNALVKSGRWESKKGCWPRNAKGAYLKDHGKLPINMPQVDVFLADKAHRKKTFGKALYNAKNTEKALKISKTDCERLKTSYGYSLGASVNDGKSFEQFTTDVQAPLYHHFDDHRFCGDFCHYREQPTTDAEKERRKRRFRVKPSVLFDSVKTIYAKFTEPAMLRQVHHSFDTQKCESLNKEVSTVAPKDKTFSLTMSLTDRVDFVVVRGTLGNHYTVAEILRCLGMRLPIMVGEYLRREDRKRSFFGEYNKRPEIRKKRSETKKASMRALLQSEVEDGKLGYVYAPGVAVLGADNGKGDGGSNGVGDGGSNDDRGAGGTASNGGNGGSSKAASCKWCGSTTHSRKSHRDCPFNKNSSNSKM